MTRGTPFLTDSLTWLRCHLLSHLASLIATRVPFLGVSVSGVSD